MINIYVGNLPYDTGDADLENIFAEHGTVNRAKVIADRASGRSRGFGFVEMSDDDEGNAAIEALNGLEMAGRKLVVNKARNQ